MKSRSDEAASPTGLCDVKHVELDSQRVGNSLSSWTFIVSWVVLVSSPESNKISLDLERQCCDEARVDSTRAQGPHGHVTKEGVVHGSTKGALQFGNQGRP